MEKEVSFLLIILSYLLMKKLKRICSAPTLYKITYKKYREASLKKFPYSLVYLINEKAKTILITSIYHHKRNPRRKYIK
jgi:mRNA-degrading endonuclease RelE of RelBE toxin-antitoxin system